VTGFEGCAAAAAIVLRLVTAGPDAVSAPDPVLSTIDPAPIVELDGEAILVRASRLAVPLSAAVERAAQEEAGPPLPGWVVPMYAGYVGLQVLDVTSTFNAQSKGYVEANPLMRSLAENHGAFIAAKVVMTTATIYAIERLRQRHPRAALATLAVLSASYTAIVVHNYRLTR
jgi:hypothetical protein